MRRGAPLAEALAALAVAVLIAAPCADAARRARAVEPLFLGWTSLLPGLPGQHTSSQYPDCAEGSPDCVDATLGEMRRRFEALLAACDHNAVFALTYIRVTESYRAAARAGLFAEPGFLAHKDAVFARLYFEAYDNWAAGRRDAVPPAWRLAFDSARGRSVPALANILLGINAHVNRDMPIMLAGLGLFDGDGRSRKRDHDVFNRLLNDVYDDVIAEVGRRFDPTTDDLDPSLTTLDNTLTFQLLPTWRELVWRHAELLARARSDRERAGVIGHIENYAVTQARLIRGLSKYPGPFGVSSARRDAWCAANGRS